MTSPRPVVLDTDIGSDVDDAMALALLLGTPELDLLGVTTVYGNTLLRARIARRYASLAGRDVPVHAGESAPRSGRAVWWAGHEGSLHEGLEREAVEPSGGVDFLLRSARAHAGELEVAAIGPLTNIAAAIERDPGFAQQVRTLWVMGGDFSDDEAEHNFRSDAAAARLVFDSGIRTVVCGLDVTRRIRIEAEQLDRIRGAGALGATLGADIDQWWQYWNETWNVPYDPVTVLALTRPSLFELSPRGRVAIRQEDAQEGMSAFEPGDGGPARVVRSLDAERVAEVIVAAIVAAGRQSAPEAPVA